MQALRGLYVITDEKLTPYKEGKIFWMVEQALKGGAKVVQLRDKTHSDEFLLKYAIELKNLCHSYDAIFIVNERLELALKSDADGIHVGKEDLPVEEVKKHLKNKIIGASCYGSIERAEVAQKQGASYVAFGSFFPSPTKPEAKVIKKEILKLAKERLKVPICAIGGITLERAGELVKLGADMIAIVSDIWKAEDIRKRAEAYSMLFK